jgi:hypothetical protein
VIAATAALLLLAQAENAEPDQVCDDPQNPAGAQHLRGDRLRAGG